MQEKDLHKTLNIEVNHSPRFLIDSWGASKEIINLLEYIVRMLSHISPFSYSICYRHYQGKNSSFLKDTQKV